MDGVNYTIKRLNYGVTAVNFLHQTGAKRTIYGAELITGASFYYNTLMMGILYTPVHAGSATQF